MAFAQLTYRESLRDIEACFRAQQTKLYHLGVRGQVSRNPLAHANSVRDWHKSAALFPLMACFAGLLGLLRKLSAFYQANSRTFARVQHYSLTHLARKVVLRKGYGESVLTVDRHQFSHC
jgi:hypothetical protein